MFSKILSRFVLLHVSTCLKLINGCTAFSVLQSMQIINSGNTMYTLHGRCLSHSYDPYRKILIYFDNNFIMYSTGTVVL